MKPLYCENCGRNTEHELVFDPWEVDNEDEIPMAILKELVKKLPGFEIGRTVINRAFDDPEKLYRCTQCDEHHWDF